MKNLTIQVKARGKQSDNNSFSWLAVVENKSKFDSMIMVHAYLRFGMYFIDTVGKRVPKCNHENFTDKKLMKEYCSSIFNLCISEVEEMN